MKTIPERQNEEPQLFLLRARQQVFREATSLLVLQSVLTVLLPMVLVVIGLFAPMVRPYTAACALVVTLLDVTVLDRLQRTKVRLSAKIAEAFDETVLGIPWNRLVSANRAPHEDIAAAERRWRLSGGKDHRLRDWYPVAVGRVPLHMSRIICQRTNLWYDGALRKHYGHWLLAIALILPALLLIAAWSIGLTIDVFITTVLAPAAPVLTWTTREYFRQKDTAAAQEVMRGETEALWAKAKAGDCDETDCLMQSRELQNAIYIRRATSALIFPGIYRKRRREMEQGMNDAAAGYLRELGL